MSYYVDYKFLNNRPIDMLNYRLGDLRNDTPTVDVPVGLYNLNSLVTIAGSTTTYSPGPFHMWKNWNSATQFNLLNLTDVAPEDASNESFFVIRQVEYGYEIKLLNVADMATGSSSVIKYIPFNLGGYSENAEIELVDATGLKKVKFRYDVRQGIYVSQSNLYLNN